MAEWLSNMSPGLQAMLPGILPSYFQLRTSTETLWLVEAKQQQRTVNTWEAGAGHQALCSSYTVTCLLSHLGMGKQPGLQPGLQLLQLPWDLPLASPILGQLLLRTLASSAGYEHH